MTDKITEIQNGLAKLAWVIETHSDDAWPIFERLEKELLQLNSRQDQLQKYRQKFG